MPAVTRAWKAWLLIVVVLLAAGPIYAFIHGREPTNDAERSAAKATALELAQRAIGKIKKDVLWDHIEVDNEPTRGHYYSLTLYYAYPPGGDSGYDEAERDTKTIARAVLSELVASGAKPTDDKINVVVFAWRRVKGETGKDLGEFWGYTAYDYTRDILVYKRKVGWLPF